VLVRALKRYGTPVSRALEIGCRHGVAREMLERDLDIAVDGCDLNRAALEMAKPGKGDLFVYNILDQEPSLLGRYDAAFLWMVIAVLLVFCNFRDGQKCGYKCVANFEKVLRFNSFGPLRRRKLQMENSSVARKNVPHRRG
jgi:hypothetical protein